MTLLTLFEDVFIRECNLVKIATFRAYKISRRSHHYINKISISVIYCIEFLHKSFGTELQYSQNFLTATTMCIVCKALVPP